MTAVSVSFVFPKVMTSHEKSIMRMHEDNVLCTERCSSKLVLVVSGTTHQLLRYEGAAIYGHFRYLWLQCVNTSYWHDKYVLPILGLHNHKSLQAIYTILVYMVSLVPDHTREKRVW